MSNETNKPIKRGCPWWLVIVIILVLFICSRVAEVRSTYEEIEDLQAQLEFQEQANEALRDAGDMLVIYRSANAEQQQTIDDLTAKYDTLRLTAAENGYWSPTDLHMIAGVVIAESGNQPLEGQMAVAQCIYDRYKNNYGGDTIYEILTAKNQFAEPFEGDRSIFPAAYEAVMRVFIFGERIYDTEVIYFYNPQTANPSAVAAFEANNEYIGTIGDHVFRSW